MNERRSFFFPILLIAAGLIWLLVNLGYLPTANLWALTRVWPFILIGVGLGLLLRDRWPLASAAVPALIVLAMLAAVIYAPQLGWAGPPGWGTDLGISGAIAGSGQLRTASYEAGGARAVQLRYPARVTFVQGSQSRVTITADDNLLEQMNVRVSNGTLIIESLERNWQRRVNPSRFVEIEITLPTLERLELDTAGQISLSGLQGDSLELEVDGAGSIELHDLRLGSLDASLEGAGQVQVSGTVGHLRLELKGVGNFEGEQLQAQTAEVTLSGVGSATVRVAERLDAEIDGLGSISYYGSPQVRQQTNGLGSINRAGD
ncbi:MAG: DUF2807 domain-containing protein [Anaerolineales bacterium]|nr:DUF2807 domain-containing protein [Anaerolineales bacterium]